MYCTRRKVIFPFVLFIERKIPPKATPRAANAIYRETQLVRLDRTQPTLNTNNDITRVASDSARYFKHKRGITYYLDMILRTTHDDFLTFFFFIYPRARLESALSEPDFEVTRHRPPGRLSSDFHRNEK